jgi:hypothetical protein
MDGIRAGAVLPLAYTYLAAHGVIDNDEYYIPVPEGEIPSQGSPYGGDISTM